MASVTDEELLRKQELVMYLNDSYSRVMIRCKLQPTSWNEHPQIKRRRLYRTETPTNSCNKSYCHSKEMPILPEKASNIFGSQECLWWKNCSWKNGYWKTPRKRCKAAALFRYARL
ncbi:uncharacterized protein [Ptychodera flava]|uniref:uncharacterized protein isoform X3 n=1 Tax=Ptychodera flava TaxID=63121 RepID=UPI003969CC0B